MTDKHALLAALRNRLAEDLSALERRQKDIQAGATHEESRSEHAKDTRATEQSYLARGLADRVRNLARTTTALASLEVRKFRRAEAIAVGALVEIAMHEADAIDQGAGTEMWFVVPGAGGIDLEFDERRIRTLTPVSPLGRALLGLSEGDEGEVRTPRGRRAFEVLSVE